MPIIVFNSTHQALVAEKALNGAGVVIEIVPLPAKLKADCGLAIEFSGDEVENVKSILSGHTVEYETIYGE